MNKGTSSDYLMMVTSNSTCDCFHVVTRQKLGLIGNPVRSTILLNILMETMLITVKVNR